jgi:hypothetical protein
MKKEVYYFDNWLKENEGQYEDEIIFNLLNDSTWKDFEIFERMAELDEEFQDFCVENHFKPSWNPLFSITEVKQFINEYKSKNNNEFSA